MSNATVATLATVRPALVPALVALALGAFLVLGAGFAGSSVLHNAAHDGRHAFAFPCH
jgi:cobalt transporter subunit CbtB